MTVVIEEPREEYYTTNYTHWPLSGSAYNDRRAKKGISLIRSALTLDEHQWAPREREVKRIPAERKRRHFCTPSRADRIVQDFKSNFILDLFVRENFVSIFVLKRWMPFFY